MRISERHGREKGHAHADIQVYFKTTVIKVVECVSTSKEMDRPKPESKIGKNLIND